MDVQSYEHKGYHIWIRQSDDELVAIIERPDKQSLVPPPLASVKVQDDIDHALSEVISKAYMRIETDREDGHLDDQPGDGK